jgi:hypothetical protein
MTTEAHVYPVTVRGELVGLPSRGLWLIKWLLAIPHFIILFFLTIAFVFVTIIAFFAIVFTGKHPKGLFDFKVGVLRWWWRVGFYGYGALATDKYPPFSLDPVPDYPADLDIPYPEKLSQSLVWVKWWLLAIPHYIIIAIFSSGGPGWIFDHFKFDGAGLVFMLAIFAGFCLLFAAKYPKDIFRLVVGMNRWILRVLAYVSLMRDEYPPFRLWDD